MKSISFVFKHAPHGNASGREGLDAVLATIAICDRVSLFFIGDGVFQLVSSQQPEKILARNYIVTFGIVSLYEVENCYLCALSLVERGLTTQSQLVLNAQILEREVLLAKLSESDHILTF